MQGVKTFKNVLQISKFTENIRERLFPISIAPLNGLSLWVKFFMQKSSERSIESKRTGATLRSINREISF